MYSVLIIVVISYVLILYGVVHEIATGGESAAQGKQRKQIDQLTYRWVILAVTVAMAFMIAGSRATLGVFLKSIVKDL